MPGVFTILSVSQTIIESLKYATTGDQPPNTKGGAFIHDPKVQKLRTYYNVVETLLTRYAAL
jgi:DNA repair exonuclease SbcCD ATPase subunit